MAAERFAVQTTTGLFFAADWGISRANRGDMPMPTRRHLVLAAALAAASGCASQSQMLQARQPVAEQTALQRGRFDLDCQSATAVVLSSDFIQPAVQGPWVSGLQRVEYTVGVEGCGKRKTYVVLCQEGTDTCLAVDPTDRR